MAFQEQQFQWGNMFNIILCLKEKQKSIFLLQLTSGSHSQPHIVRTVRGQPMDQSRHLALTTEQRLVGGLLGSSNSVNLGKIWPLIQASPISFWIFCPALNKSVVNDCSLIHSMSSSCGLRHRTCRAVETATGQ